MTINGGEKYTLCTDPYPWTSEFAQAHSVIGATLLTEPQARKLLDGQTIEITDPTPNQSSFIKGDLNVSGRWVRGILKTGPLTGSSVAVLDIWLQTSLSQKSCSCDINALMASGCKCGGA